MEWIKQNWFQVGLLAVVLVVGFSVVGFLQEKKNILQKEEFSTHVEDEDYEKSSIAEDQEVPFDWAVPDSILPIMSDTLETYREGYTSIKTTMDGEKEIQNDAYELLGDINDPVNKQWLLQLLNLSKEYTNAGASLLVWLDTATTYYERLIGAINTRNEAQFSITSVFIEEHESKKEGITNDFIDKEKAKQDFAASGI